MATIAGNQMIKPATLRKIAAFGLLACFFLPLSKCTLSSGVGATTDDYRFPFEHITQGINDVREQGTLLVDSLPLMIVTFIVFLGPVAMLRLGAALQSRVHLALAVPAEWLLYQWSTIGELQIGAVLAMLSWAVLCIAGVMTLWQLRPSATQHAD